MKRIFLFLPLLLIGLLVFGSVASASDGKSAPGYQTGFTVWRASDSVAGLSTWTTDAAIVRQADGALALNPAAGQHGYDTPGAYNGKNYYNGGDYWFGEATSPVLTTPFAFQEAIASWNAATPPGAWVEVQARASLGGRFTKWYVMGIWASGTSAIQRHSVRLQGDADGFVAVDTLVLNKGKVPADGLQLKVRLFSADQNASPVVRSLSLAYSTAAPDKVTPSTGSPANWVINDLPDCSQMVYPDGGNVWCSPTSTSMVLGYWGFDPGPCEQRVRAAVAGVYDWVYDGHGNWPFNTAYAASRSSAAHPVMEGYVRRYASLAELEPWIKAGVPVVMSIAWKKGELTNAAVSSSNGHLIVLVGFDADGNAVVNDPAASTDADVNRTYNRAELESIWLKASGGTVYLIYPEGEG